MKKLISIILVITLTLTFFTSCGATDKALVSTYLNLGEKYLTDLDYEQAIVYFNKVIEVEPNNARAYVALAEAYTALGDTESAIEILKTALEVFSDDTNTTIEVYEKLAEVDSSNYVWYIEPAQVYISQGDTENAASILQQGLENAESTEEIEKLLETVAEESEEDGDSSDSTESQEDKHPTIEYNSDGSYIEYEYDENWNVIKETSYDSDENVSSVCEYDSDGNVLTTIKYKYNSDGGWSETEYVSDTDTTRNAVHYKDGTWWEDYWVGDLLVKHIDYDSDGSVYDGYEFDSEGNTRLKWVYLSNGWIEYEYDSNGKETKVTSHDIDDTIISVGIYEYDSDGKLSQIKYYDADGNFTGWEEYVYDSDGNLTGRYSRDADGNSVK